MEFVPRSTINMRVCIGTDDVWPENTFEIRQKNICFPHLLRLPEYAVKNFPVEIAAALAQAILDLNI